MSRHPAHPLVWSPAADPPALRHAWLSSWRAVRDDVALFALSYVAGLALTLAGVLLTGGLV